MPYSDSMYLAKRPVRLQLPHHTKLAFRFVSPTALLSFPAIILLTWFAIGDQPGGDTRTFALCLLLFSVCPLLWELWRGLQTAMPLFGLAMLFNGLSFAYPVFNDFEFRYGLTYLQLQQALEILGIGLTTFAIGYYGGRHVVKKPVALGRRLLSHAEFPSVKYWLPIGIILWMTSVLYDFSGLSITALAQLAKALNGLGLTFVLAGALIGKAPMSFRLVAVSVVLGFEFLQAFTSGLLAQPFFLAVLVFSVFYFFRRRIPWVGLIALVLMIVIFNPVKQEYRKLTWQQQFEGSSVAKVMLFFELAFDYHLGNGASSHADNVYKGIESRVENMTSLAVVVDETPDLVPFRYGSTFEDLYVGWIPRILWPGKPISDLGNRWAKWYGLLQPNDFVTSYNLPWIVEFYLNFGAWGVLIGMLLAGCFYRLIEQLFFYPTVRAVPFLIGISLVQSLWWMESNVGLTIGNLVTKIVTLVVVIKLLKSFLLKTDKT